MPKKLSLILGLIGSGFVLLQNLWMTVQFLINFGAMDLADVYTYSSIFYFGGMIVLSAAALAGSLLINKKPLLAGVLLCASGFLMFIFGLVTFGITMIIPVIVIIGAGVLVFVAKDDHPQIAKEN